MRVWMTNADEGGRHNEVVHSLHGGKSADRSNQRRVGSNPELLSNRRAAWTDLVAEDDAISNHTDFRSGYSLIDQPMAHSVGVHDDATSEITDCVLNPS